MAADYSDWGRAAQPRCPSHRGILRTVAFFAAAFGPNKRCPRRLGRHPVQAVEKVRRRNPFGAAVALDHPRAADLAAGQEDRTAQTDEASERMLAPVRREGVLQNLLLSAVRDGEDQTLHRTRHVAVMVPSTLGRVANLEGEGAHTHGCGEEARRERLAGEERGGQAWGVGHLGVTWPPRAHSRALSLVKAVRGDPFPALWNGG
jgi:hypothetical protein